MSNNNATPLERARKLLFGKARDIYDNTTFHKISLVAFFAWIGLGADGISSSCYGPEEAFKFLGSHHSLAIFVALGTIFTIYIISSSYLQIIKLFPQGGGGYLVASKLISPTVGMVSGCSLLIDYLLTITLSISSGADAIFSFLPPQWHAFKLSFAVIILLFIIVINLRGVKESVLSMTPIFILFIATHVFLIFYVFIAGESNFVSTVASTGSDIHSSISELGILGTFLLVLKAYSMGAGTFTGIEAVSNGMPILREPREKTAKKTMLLMAGSLSFMVFGLLIGYALYKVQQSPVKTMNAVLLDSVTMHWNITFRHLFIFITLLSEAALLFVAAQTGFIDGPRIMSNMGADLWFPKRFTSLSDRLVTQNGVMLMGTGAILLMIFTKGSVALLVVLYSINVFITFSLSQLGMVKHWWSKRNTVAHWKRKLSINGIGLVLTSFILISVIIIKFREGGWVTLIITGMLVILAMRIRLHYYKTKIKLQQLRVEVYKTMEEKLSRCKQDVPVEKVKFDENANTAIILVSGFGGTGLYSFMKIIDSFNGVYKNFIFMRVGILNAKNFKGSQEFINFKQTVIDDGNKYIKIANQMGFYAKSLWTMGTDPVLEVENMLPRLLKHIKNPTFFGGQLVFLKTFSISRLLHNHTIFIIQKRLYKQGIPVIVIPIIVKK
jgi:amino acid transporter